MRDNHSLWIRTGFPPGDYVLQLALLTPQAEEVPMEAAEEARVVEGWLELTIMLTGD